MQYIGKLLIIISIITFIIGFLLVFVKHIPFHPGKLPGDIYIQKGNFSFYLPITTGIIISVIVSIIIAVAARFLK